MFLYLYISINIYSTMPWNILIDREFCIHWCRSFFQKPLFNLLLKDVVKWFSANFPILIKALPKRPEKLTRRLAIIAVMNALFEVSLWNFVPEILTLKMSPEADRPRVNQNNIWGPWWRLTQHKRRVGWQKNWASAPMRILMV